MKNIQKYLSIGLSVVLLLSLTACSPYPPMNESIPRETESVNEPKENAIIHAEDNLVFTNIILSDSQVLVDGVVTTTEGSVFVAHDVVYYEAGKDFTYGEGSVEESHTAEEALAHTVVHIAAPGNYMLSGSLEAGQIAIDLGDDAKENPNAIVNLYLNGVNITNTVAPGIIFYNVYECGNTNADTAANTVDTSSAGANIFIVDGTENTVTGSHVARIYKSETVVLNEDKTAVAEAKKLHKYDGAVYSCMTMNVNSYKGDTGILNIVADNEGLDTELHLTINSGNINIRSGNDGINTNEDNVSVTTINGGNLNIVVTGTTGEGDGIDSNGWLVINGGTVNAQACGFSGDAGIDSDMGISINGGTVYATGNMLDRIAESKQTFVVFEFETQAIGAYLLKDVNENVIAEFTAENAFKYLLMSNENIKAGSYTLWDNADVQLEGYPTTMRVHGGRPGGEAPKDLPDGIKPPENVNPGEMRPPEFPEGGLGGAPIPPLEGIEIPRPPVVEIPAPPSEPPIEPMGSKTEAVKDSKKSAPTDEKKSKGEKEKNVREESEISTVFEIKDGANYFFIVMTK